MDIALSVKPHPLLRMWLWTCFKESPLWSLTWNTSDASWLLKRNVLLAPWEDTYWLFLPPTLNPRPAKSHSLRVRLTHFDAVSLINLTYFNTEPLEALLEPLLPTCIAPCFFFLIIIVPILLASFPGLGTRLPSYILDYPPPLVFTQYLPIQPHVCSSCYWGKHE